MKKKINLGNLIWLYGTAFMLNRIKSLFLELLKGIAMEKNGDYRGNNRKEFRIHTSWQQAKKRQ